MSTVRTSELSALIRDGRPANDPSVKNALIGLSQEVQSRLQAGSTDSRDFFISAVEIVAGLKGSTHRSLRADCLLNCCQYFYFLGDSSTALDPARRAAKLAQQLNDQEREATALNTLGIVLADTGNFVEAVECYSKALQTNRTRNLRDAEARSWVNLGVALMYMSRYQEALECFRQSDCSSDEANRKVVATRAAHNASICWFHLGDLEQARDWAEFSTTNCPDPTNAYEKFTRVNRELSYVQILLELRDFSKAHARAEIASRILTADIPRAALVQRLIRGLVEAYCGDHVLGLSELNAVLEAAKDNPPFHQDALIALARSRERAGDFTGALGHLQELLAVSQNRRQQSALLHVGSAGRSVVRTAGDHLDLAHMRERQSQLRAQVAEERLSHAQFEMLERLAIAGDLRDDPSGQHGFRVGRLSYLLAEKLGHSAEQCLTLELAARLHDIGKSAIPDRIVTSSESLREGERQLMNAHAQVGSEILAKSNLGQVKLAEEVARCHHERWDGSGYPNGIRGNRIPESARIVALADVFDAMTHGRSYADAWSVQKALAEIQAQSAAQFDPDMTTKFVELIQALSANHRDLDEILAQASSNSPFFRARARIRRLIESASSASSAVEQGRPS
ncbi:hypothetical protein DSM104443_02074 [Usitatibacter rugosus]|uniref:HD-GYP domain-containing protein n=1 Tax=Usitatibacter rugosus TaxID=2732067 RepID=A0A6M4GX98_9PROT|nr:hypothetical protein DSM104443_02074 [Usitatibacter rugosus]